MRFDNILVGTCLLVATLVGLWQIRGGAFAAGMATVPLAAWIATWRKEGGNPPLSAQLKMLAAWLLSINLIWGGLGDGPSSRSTARAAPVETAAAIGSCKASTRL